MHVCFGRASRVEQPQPQPHGHSDSVPTTSSVTWSRCFKTNMAPIVASSTQVVSHLTPLHSRPASRIPPMLPISLKEKNRKRERRDSCCKDWSLVNLHHDIRSVRPARPHQGLHVPPPWQMLVTVHQRPCLKVREGRGSRVATPDESQGHKSQRRSAPQIAISAFDPGASNFALPLVNDSRIRSQRASKDQRWTLNQIHLSFPIHRCNSLVIVDTSYTVLLYYCTKTNLDVHLAIPKPLTVITVASDRVMPQFFRLAKTLSPSLLPASLLQYRP